MIRKRPCIVCSRSIKRRLSYYHISPPKEAFDGISGGFSMAAYPEKPDGLRERNTFYLADMPTTKEQAQRLVNEPVVGASFYQGRITRFTTWDGESFIDEFFCTDRCARKQGYASANQGDRYLWKPAP